ncbi:type II CAAX endopeptidase family protein [Sphingomonas sp.]|uniref:CPBP family intramembrane glutamic endopeptidase n=1 Tax=Sphingomonas sp. TaxID=28214 RepID=UPI002BD80337|nr:type II CAAX endopeptidase family protein [Sphingomonas sp.]HTG39007.1 type II CAAX endopeptidase family protein [Sphingomonas sp.]
MADILNKTPVRCIGVLVIFGLLFLPVALPMRVLMLAAVALLWTYLAAGNLTSIGLSRHPLVPTVAWAAGIAITVLAFGHFIQPVLNRSLGSDIDLSGYGALAGNAEVALRLLGMALTSAAFGEEILFRGFLLHQLTAVLGSGARARWAAIVAGAVLFGFAHAMQGPVGMVTTGLVACLFGWAWFRSGRNLWAMILAHALIDSFGISMLYLGWTGM